MKQTALEYLEENLIAIPYSEQDFEYNNKCWNKAKEMEDKQKGYSEEDMLLFAKFVYQDDGSFIDNDGNVKKDTLEQFKHYKQQEQ